MELLSKTEYAVMEIFWDRAEPITNHEVQMEYLRRYPEGIKTVHNITSRLLKKGYIKEGVVVKIKKRFAQKFAVVVLAEEYLRLQITRSYALKKNPDKAAKFLLEAGMISEDAAEEIKKLLSEA